MSHAPLHARPAPSDAPGATRWLDAFWRALVYCLHPRVIGLSLLPLLVSTLMLGALAWFGWEPATEWVRVQLQSWAFSAQLLSWIEAVAGSALRLAVAPLLVLLVMVPVVLVVSLLVVAWLMTPALVTMVANRRFPALSQSQPPSWVASAAWSIGSSLAALLAMLLTLPLWLIPPFALLLPPLIWGWLTYRVMAFDALGMHASSEERRALMRSHRVPLWLIGVTTGLLGAAPALLWSVGLLGLALAPLLVPVAVWLYTLIFAFSSLWFAHYLLDALQALRLSRPATAVDAGPAVPVIDPPRLS